MGKTTIDSGSIRNGDIASSANIEATKMQHRHKIGCDFGLAYTDTVADEERIVFVATAACTINYFKAKVQGAESGANSVDFDLKKNGSSILSAAITINSGSGTSVQTGTISNATLAADDVLSMEMDTTSSDATGGFCWVEIDENPS